MHTQPSHYYSQASALTTFSSFYAIYAPALPPSFRERFGAHSLPCRQSLSTGFMNNILVYKGYNIYVQNFQ